MAQAARKVWSRYRCDKFHRSVPVQLAVRKTVRRRVARLARHGQQELENHLSLRAPMARQDMQTQVEKYLSTVYHQQSPQLVDIGTAETKQKCQSCGSLTHKRSECWYRDETCTNCGKQGHMAKVCRSEKPQKQNSNSSKGTGKGNGKDSGKGKGRNRSRTRSTCMCCGKKGHMKADCKFMYTACSNCRKIGHLRAVCRTPNTHEVEQDTEEPSPEVTVEAVWCMNLQKHC